MTELSPRAELLAMLRPAGGGIIVFSTGTAQLLAQQRKIYRCDVELEGEELVKQIDQRWKASLARLHAAKVVILGVPSDVGAGYQRGANLGPIALRGELVRRGSFVYDDPRIVDVGDVRVIPQLLEDEMLNDAQLARSRAALYGDARTPLPVSPLSMAARALAAIAELAPHAVPLVLGGDHSVAWPVIAQVARGRERQTGILHFDAHTDLLAERMGIRTCFATWAYHANELVGREQRLVQVGIRATRRTQAQWEQELGVRQIWMPEIAARSVDELADEIEALWDRAGVQGVYVSNDIDGTDPGFARATGTPEPDGLSPATVTQLIARICRKYPLWGSDLVEVAPPLAESAGEPLRTLETAAEYIELQARLSLSCGAAG
jgi:guanidinobutyrase